MKPFDFFQLDWIWSYLWPLFRIGGFFVAAPIWGHRAIPAKVKIPVVVALAIAVGPIVIGVNQHVPTSLLQVFAWAIPELIIGGIIGFCFATLLWAVRMAGDLIGLQMGFSIATVIDPNSSEQTSLIGEFKYVLMLLLLLALDGHHLMIGALVDTYRLIPFGGAVFGGGALDLIVRLSAVTFNTAIKIGAPVFVALLLTDVALGIVARTVPQMNVLVVGFPVKIGVGFLVLAAALPFTLHVFSRSLSQIQVDTQQIVAALAHP